MNKQAPSKPPLHLLKDMKGVLELAESTEMGKDDWNVQVSFIIIIILLIFYF